MKNRDFGGAFDPIHKVIYTWHKGEMEEYSLDRILLVPGRGHSGRTRLRMQ